MPTSVPAPFQALFAGASEGDRAAVDLLCRLVDTSSEVLLEVNGRRVPLPASLRSLLQRVHSSKRLRARCCSRSCTW
jgi:hypothetical protein